MPIRKEVPNERQQQVLCQGLCFQQSQDRWQEAGESFERSLAIYQAMDNCRGEADQHTNLGILRALEGALSDAEQNLQRAFTLYGSLELPDQLARVTELLINLAQLQQPHATLH